MPARKDLVDKLSRYTVNEKGCWIWSGCRCSDGYGKINAMRECDETLAHRAAYWYWVGIIPDGCEIDHLCRNRACINPEHLEAVSHAINIQRGARAGPNHRNTRKTHCIRGHELAGANLVMEDGARKCRACRNARMRAFKAKRRAERRAI